ncbi:MAG: hypothetical protein KAZ87_06530 [Spirochaetes bacterium]|nr:hypothetical protein [Spirochaetota bacterium]
MNKTIFVLLILCFFYSCYDSGESIVDEDIESSLKKIKIINNTEKTVSIFRIREKNGVPEQRLDSVASGSFIYISVQYKIHVDGQFSAVCDGSIRGYDADISSGDPQTIIITPEDFQ